MRYLHIVACFLLVTGARELVAGPVNAQTYPVKPIRIICASPGASGDFSARLIAQGLTTNLGQQVIVDNRGGYSSIDAVTKATPDGYTLHLPQSLRCSLPQARRTHWSIVSIRKLRACCTARICGSDF